MRQQLQSVDPKTGRKLFVPAITRPPVVARNTARLPICDYLFASRHEFADIREQLADIDATRARELREARYVSRTSDRIIQDMTRKAYV